MKRAILTFIVIAVIAFISFKSLREFSDRINSDPSEATEWVEPQNIDVEREYFSRATYLKKVDSTLIFIKCDTSIHVSIKYTSDTLIFNEDIPIQGIISVGFKPMAIKNGILVAEKIDGSLVGLKRMEDDSVEILLFSDKELFFIFATKPGCPDILK